MKIYLANSSKQSIGGGWSWISNFRKGMGDLITDDYNEAHVYLIPSPTMVQREDVLAAKAEGKKIVLRIDNAVRNSRNRNTGMSRMKDFALWADLIVFQSDWAKDYLMPFLNWGQQVGESRVILNGIDLDVFKPTKVERRNIYLYSRYNRDETKNWEMARYVYSQLHLDHKAESELWIVGQFSPELVAGNFDFYNGERFKFWGVQEHDNLVTLYQNSKSLLYTYFNDACSNTLIEALCMGCEITDPYGMMATGGSAQIAQSFHTYGRDYFSLNRMCDHYKEAIGAIL